MKGTEATVIKTMWYCHRDRDQWNRQCPEINPSIDQLIFDKGVQNNSVGKE